MFACLSRPPFSFPSPQRADDGSIEPRFLPFSFPPPQLADDGSLAVVLANPLSAPTLALGYSLTVAPKGACLADCSGHGACDAATGLCACTVRGFGRGETPTTRRQAGV